MSDLVREAFEAHYFSCHGGGNMTFDHANSYYLDSEVNDYWLAFQAGEQAALSANGGEVVGWLVSRKGDGTFPRFYFDKGLAEDMVKEVELPPSATMSPVYTHPAPSVPENEVKARGLEEYADQLDVVFANAQEAGANDCPAWHAGQFAKDARKQAARLRTAGDEENKHESM